MEMHDKKPGASLAEERALKMLNIKSMDDVIGMDYPDKDMDFNREQIMRGVHRSRCSVRISSGRFYTNEEFEKRRKRVMAMPL